MADFMLIPTARLVAPELQAEFGPIPPALLPLEGTPAYRHIGQATLDNNGNLLLAAHENFEVLHEDVRRTKNDHIQIVDVGNTHSLGETILKALASAPVIADRIVVNFADTFVGDLPKTGDVICFREQDDTQRWTTFTMSDGAISKVIDKDIEKSDEPQMVFVGSFAFTNHELLVQALQAAIANRRKDVDPFYSALTEYSLQVPMHAHEVTVWHDFGHIDTYYSTRQKFFLNKRFFNAVEVDTERGVIRKTSRDHKKLSNEISWYLGLPKSLAHLAPRVLDYSLDSTNVYVDMEFYGYPPLAESYLHGAWEAGVWRQVMKALGQTVQAMQAHSVPVNKDLLVAMYRDKTLQRTQQVTDALHFFPLLDDEVVINGQRCIGLNGVHNMFDKIIERSQLLERDALTVVHGDLCLSNILFDRRTSIVRLIDPRGSFGDGFSIYGDPLYDLAKLRHSFCGDYDHLVHGKFDLAMNIDGVFLETHLTERQRTVKRHAMEWIDNLAGADHRRVQLIESLLFLSMVPLHADKPRSQQAFLARGLELFTIVARQLGMWHAPRVGNEKRIEVPTK